MELSSLVRLFRIAHFKPNLKADTDGLNPPFSPADSFGRPEDDDHALDLFMDGVRLADDSEYGDFMRRVNLYLCRLRSHLRHRDDEILARIDTIQIKVQFLPDAPVDTTRLWVLKQAIDLRSCIREKERERLQKRRRGLAFVSRRPPYPVPTGLILT